MKQNHIPCVIKIGGGKAGKLEVPSCDVIVDQPLPETSFRRTVLLQTTDIQLRSKKRLKRVPSAGSNLENKAPIESALKKREMSKTETN